MIHTVLFDMGGTLEDIWYSDQTIEAVTDRLLEMLEQNGLDVRCESRARFWAKVSAGVARYKKWSEGTMREKKPEEIWPDYYLADFDLNREKLAAISEDLAGMWEVTYYHRELRDGVEETLRILADRGYRLGVISNTASLYSVFDVLEAYGIRSLFENVTLSSVTGYRKPHPAIFQIAMREMCVRPAECIYVGDTISRDIIGAKRAGFGGTAQIRSFLSPKKDANVETAEKPDYLLTEISDLAKCLPDLKNG